MPIPAGRAPGYVAREYRYNDPVYGLDAMYSAKRRAKSGSGRLRNFVRRTARDCMRREAELKHYTYAFSYAPTSALGQLNYYTTLGQGTAANQRIGNYVRLQEFRLYGDLFLGTTVGSDTCRIMIVLDTEPKGTAAAVTDILNSASVLSSYNLANVSCPGRTKNRFHVLRDQSYGLCNGAATGTSVNKPVRMAVKLRCQAFYNGVAGTVSDLLKNHILVLVISANGGCATYLQGQLCWIDQ